MNKKLIIFDIDGTLLYSNKIDSQCFADTYERRYQEAFPSLDWRTFPHVTDDTIFGTVIQNHFDRPATAEEIHEFQDEYVALLEEKRKIAPHEFMEVKNSRKTIELLLADDGYEVGIATGGWRRPAFIKLNHVGIPTRHLHMSFADGNPTRENIIEGVFDQTNALNLAFEKIVYVGDAVWDVETTRNMNLPFIGVRRQGDFEVLEKEGAQTIVSDYANHDQFLSAVEAAQPPKKIKA